MLQESLEEANKQVQFVEEDARFFRECAIQYNRANWRYSDTLAKALLEMDRMEEDWRKERQELVNASKNSSQLQPDTDELNELRGGGDVGDRSVSLKDVVHMYLERVSTFKKEKKELELELENHKRVVEVLSEEVSALRKPRDAIPDSDPDALCMRPDPIQSTSSAPITPREGPQPSQRSQATKIPSPAASESAVFASASDSGRPTTVSRSSTPTPPEPAVHSPAAEPVQTTTAHTSPSPPAKPDGHMSQRVRKIESSRQVAPAPIEPITTSDSFAPCDAETFRKISIIHQTVCGLVAALYVVAKENKAIVVQQGDIIPWWEMFHLRYQAVCLLSQQLPPALKNDFNLEVHESRAMREVREIKAWEVYFHNIENELKKDRHQLREVLVQQMQEENLELSYKDRLAATVTRKKSFLQKLVESLMTQTAPK